MKLSSFAKYLRLRVINTEVPLKVAFMALFFLSANAPLTAQNGITKPFKNATQPAMVRGDVTGVPEVQFRILGEAVRLQREADSITVRAGRLSREAGTVPPQDRERLEKIAAAEAAKAAARAAEADSLILSLSRDESSKPDTPSVPENSRPQEVHQLSLFEIRPAPAYTLSNPVPVDPPLPAGLVYTVQIAAFRNIVPPPLFKGLFPVFGRKRQGSDAVYYYSGLFRRLDDAKKALPEARGEGFPDAFIIALMDGTQVSMERATLLEKEWWVQPLHGINAGIYPSDSSPSASQPGAPPGQAIPVRTLSFRAEVLRINKPVKPEVIQKIEQLAGTRGLEMIKNNNGETVFLIGNFITFESADDYVSLLIRNGYNSARVAAYVGMQEIPVDAAIELINKLPDD